MPVSSKQDAVELFLGCSVLQGAKLPRDRALLLSAFLILCILIIDLPTPAFAVDYSVQAILPLSGPNGEQFEQWGKAIKMAASEVSATWTPTNSLQVDILDSYGDLRRLQSMAAAAVVNNSVVAVLTDEQGAAGLSGFASSFHVRFRTTCYVHAPSSSTRHDSVGAGKERLNLLDCTRYLSEFRTSSRDDSRLGFRLPPNGHAKDLPPSSFLCNPTKGLNTYRRLLLFPRLCLACALPSLLVRCAYALYALGALLFFAFAPLRSSGSVTPRTFAITRRVKSCRFLSFPALHR
jgi:hypothetical protein